MFNIFKQQPVEPLYVIWHIEPLSKNERENIIISRDARDAIIHYVEIEIAKANATLSQPWLSNETLRQRQWFVQWLIHVRSFLRTVWNK